MAEPEVYVRSVREVDTWTKWKRLCTTSVADVPLTTLTLNDWVSGKVNYCVKNGICYVWVDSLISSTMATGNQIIARGLPKPLRSDWYPLGASTPANNVILVWVDGNLVNNTGINDVAYFGSFSYPVAES